jgi:hypothetical protein
MKRIVITLILTCSIAFVTGQENKFSLGFIGGYDINNIEETNLFGITQGHDYSIEPSFSFGLLVRFNFNERLFLKSGIDYTKRGYNVGYINFIAIDPIINDPAIPKESTLTINYLNIPLSLGYYIKNKGNLRLFVTSGANTEFLPFSSTQSISYNGTESNSSSNQSLPFILFSVQQNLGVEYHIRKKLFIAFNPYLRYTINELSTNEVFYEKTSYGIQLSINYKFLKKEKDE